MSEKSNPSGGSEQRLIKYDVDERDNDLFQASEPDEAERVLNHVAKLQNELRQGLVSETVGLDTDRVTSFLERYGLSVCPYAVVPKEESGKTLHIIRSAGYEKSKEVIGSYLPEADFAFVFRDNQMEDLNGVEYTETLLVHELAHGSSEHNDIVYHVSDSKTDPDVLTPRTGQLTTDQGSYFEEGFAALMQYIYTRDELGLPHGFIREAKSQRFKKTFPDGSLTVRLPLKYRAKSIHTLGGVNVPEFAAFGMELLMQKDPEILNALIKARKGADGLREVAQRVDALSPGLYAKLRHLSYDDTHFVLGTRIIIDALYNGDEKAAASSLV